MPTTDTEPGVSGLSAEEQEAMEYVRDIKAFYVHLFTYVVVIVGLTIANLLVSPGYYWVLWSAFGWGVGVLVHGLSVFEVVDFFGDAWEKRQIQKRLRRHQ